MLVLPRKTASLEISHGMPDAARAACKLRQTCGCVVETRTSGQSIVLEGTAQTYEQKVNAGWAAARFGFKGVINDILVPGVEDEHLEIPRLEDDLLEGSHFDVVVIGGGIIGAAIARELSKWDLAIILVEKEGDVAVHTSSRNDGMIHDGFGAKPGSKKAAYNVRGNRLWESWCRELGVDFKRPGSLVLFDSPAAVLAYPLMADRARRNGVDGWEFWSRSRVAAMEPDAAPGYYGGFFLPSAGVLSPYRATIALAENALRNGVRIALDTCVYGMELEARNIVRVKTNRGAIGAGLVVNAAGNWADTIAGMAGDRFFSLHQRRGTDAILDASSGAYQRHIMSMPKLFQLHARTKGGGLITTVEGNVLVGPTASESPGREDYATRPEELYELEKHLCLNKRLSMNQVIAYFSGVRPCTYEEDFIVEKSDRVSNLVHAAGIQSPGLASAPAIAEDITRFAVGILSGGQGVRPRAAWQAGKPAVLELRRQPVERRDEIIVARPAYGRIVCRCEEVSEGEIVDAFHGAVPATGLDGIKRRTRAGAGRCHGGFCTPRVMEIAARELGTVPWAITKKGPGSELCVGPTKKDAP
jgi:glycerol-3-phosphate dehydrogenase